MWEFIRNSFMRGVAVIVPIVITVWVLQLLFTGLDRFVSPALDRLGWNFPGLGFLTMLILILFVGMLSRNLVGKIILRTLEGLIKRIPLARTIYSAVREVMSAFSPGQQGRSFRQVVLVEYPRKGIYSIGFVTNSIQRTTQDGKGEELYSIYFPHPPNPTSGVMVMLPSTDVTLLDMPVEEGLKLALSGGIVAPEQLQTAPPRPAGASRQE